MNIRNRHLAIQPQCGDATAEVESQVVGIVFHVGLPGTGEHLRVQIHLVLLLRRIPLHGADELLARLRVLRPPQCLPHLRGS